MRRPHGTFWCGYVDIGSVQTSLDAFPERWDILTSKIHGGITGGYKGYTGFDCAHYNDFFVSRDGSCFRNNVAATYKDHDYVLGIIRNMIDYLVSNDEA